MKAIEANVKVLMIGDWVLVKPFPDSKPVKSKVTAINYNSYRGKGYTDWVDTEFWDELSLNEIEPIPLTPEILEKNGFEDIGDNTYQLTERPYWFWVDFYNHEYGCEFDTSTYEYEDSEHRLNLKGIPYVHELQHALRLCRIEKEIIL